MALQIKKEQMRDAKIFLGIICILCLSNCDFRENSGERNYELGVHNSHDSNTYLTIGVFEHENSKNRIPAIFQLNGLVLYNDKLSDTTFQILPNDYSIKVGAISKKWTKVERFEAMKGDSISIKIYLKNDLSPLE